MFKGNIKLTKVSKISIWHAWANSVQKGRTIFWTPAIFFAVLLFCLHTHNQWHCPQCTSSTDTLLTAEACYCLCTATAGTVMEPTAGAEPSGAPRVSFAFRVACNGAVLWMYCRRLHSTSGGYIKTSGEAFLSEVSTRKVPRPATSTQVFLGFPVSISKFWDGSQHSKLPLHASHVALPT